MRAIVTGCAGFVGSHLVESLLSIGYEVVGIDNFRTGREQFMKNFMDNKKFTFHDKDLCEITPLDDIFKNIEIIYHMAANADVRGGVHDPHVDLNYNLIMTHKILEGMRRNNIGRLCFASTAAALGEPDSFPTPEAIPIPVQTSIYGASKMSCEHFISAYSNSFGIEAHVFRFVSLLGPRYPHGHVIDFVKKLKKNPEILYILGDGTAQKSYLHISDCVTAIKLVCEDIRPASNSKIKYQVYNLGFDGYVKVHESAELISQVMELKPKFIFQQQKRGWIGDNPFVHLSIEKIKLLGWEPVWDIRSSIRDTVEWLLDEDWMLL